MQGPTIDDGTMPKRWANEKVQLRAKRVSCNALLDRASDVLFGHDRVCDDRVKWTNAIAEFLKRDRVHGFETLMHRSRRGVL